MAETTMDRDEWMRRTGPLFPALVALRSLTIVRLPPGLDYTAEDMTRGAVWFPVVGALVGAVPAIVVAIGLGGVAPAVVGILGLAIAMVLGGGLAELGVAHSADTLASGEEPDPYAGRGRALGSAGFLALLVLLALRGAGLLGTDTDDWVGALIATQVVLHWVPLFLIRIGDRLGEPMAGRRTMMVGEISWATLGIATAIAAGVCLIATGLFGLLIILLAAGAAFGLGLLFERRFGGLDPAALAAAAAACEALVWIAFAIAHPAASSAWVL